MQVAQRLERKVKEMGITRLVDQYHISIACVTV